MNKYLLLALTISCLLGSCKRKTDDKTDEPPTKVQKKTDFAELYQYYHANPTTLEQRDENTIIDYAADQGMDAVRTRSGIYIVNHRVGKGDSIKWGDPITVHYRGYLLGGQEFDSSYKRGKPISFRVGSMIAGWNEALPFLRIGSEATLLIPSHMGYGKRGFPGFVEPDEILAFDIEILTKENEKE